MKSKYFTNLARGLVIVSAALALVNCNESTTAANDALNDPTVVADPSNPADPTNPSDPGQVILNPNQSENPADPSDPSQTIVDPTDPSQQGANQSQNPTDPNVIDPTKYDPIQHELDPGYGGEEVVDPTPVSSSSSVKAKSSSSEAVKPASSSSEQKVESSSSEAKDEGGIFLADDTDENKNYMEVEYIRNTADNGGGVLCYPKRLSDTKKHAVVLWGPGGGSNPNDYEGIIRRLASHGFVVVATSESPSSTARGKPALDWLEKKNNTPGDVLYQKLDMTKVGASGHSMGGLQSEQMLINDKRVITALLNNSGDLGHTAMSYVSAEKTIAIVYGEGGMERPNAEADYHNQGVKAPACLIKMTGGQGNECQQGECGWGHGSGPWGGMAATVAWMRWHLGGEDFRKADFVGSTGRYIDGAIVGQPGKWKGQCKNF